MVSQCLLYDVIQICGTCSAMLVQANNRELHHAHYMLLTLLEILSMKIQEKSKVFIG